MRFRKSQFQGRDVEYAAGTESGAGPPSRHRYVSGYLHADPSAEPGHTTVGESHAWVEYWTGSWYACDPTNGAPVRERHIVVARGRDYDDISPLKGIYHGPPPARSTSPSRSPASPEA